MKCSLRSAEPNPYESPRAKCGGAGSGGMTLRRWVIAMAVALIVLGLAIYLIVGAVDWFRRSTFNWGTKPNPWFTIETDPP